MGRGVIKESLLGTGSAYAATKLMDRVTTAYRQRQSEASLEQEQRLLDEPAYVKAAKRLAEARGEEPDQQAAEQVGRRLHVGLGVSGGVIAGVLAARGMNSIAAGMLTGLGIWLFVDEGANAVLGLTPPAPAFPRETHLRGLVGHLAYGAALGALLGIGNLILGRRGSKG